MLNVLGMYPGDPGPPGGDCAGVVVSSGPGVAHLLPGDAVFGLAGGSLGSHVRVDAQMLTQVGTAAAAPLHFIVCPVHTLARPAPFLCLSPTTLC